MKRLITILAVVSCAVACDDVNTDTVSRCYPNEGDCEDFMGANARVEASVQLGLQVYQKSCATCHGSDGKGAGNMDRGDFTATGWHRRWSDSELMGIVTAGRGTKMPGFRLPTRELKSVIAYVRAFDEARGKSDKVIEKIEGQGPKGPY